MAWFERPAPEMGTEGDVIGQRIGAIIIDIVLIAIVSSVISGILAQVRLAFLGSLFGLVIGFGYYIYLEGTYGQTVGKMALDIVVVTEDGDPIEYGPAAIRTVLRIVDALPAFYLIGIVAVLVTDRKQRLGDIVADTVVVRAGETGSMR
ncbi:RDD family protein [Haloarcula sp. Atlit-120R]|uniref:RDD family protein n=1 Tax=Haloarcula sp. Atlit-120R TaxID=2282135 RepID=UPI000EF1EBA2|nr:RDD family protein [Haloarcula sp. Atlit-120R]RLM36490.1 RDD family protein [Haloarcula sp. Atlit-120R]